MYSRFYQAFLLTFLIWGQGQTLFCQPIPTSADVRLKGHELRKTLKDQSLLDNLEADNIGPSIFSCRVTDLDVNPADATEMYVAYASGGLWHTTNNGLRFNPVFDHEASMTIGDIAVDWKNRVIWVGTGESNSSRSSYAGTGIYRSADGGKTWEHRGLPESHHIGRIVLHPTDPNTLWVAVLGHLYSPNPERGVYKTTDGGLTWNRTLFVNDNSGAIDLVSDPNDPNTLYAATWERSRRAWNFSGAGKGSGIWKSTDGGNNWTSIVNGFPIGPNTGRIGLSAGLKNGKTVLYACVDNQNLTSKKEETKEETLTKDQLRSISKQDFLKLADEKIDDYLKSNGFPEKYTAKKVKGLVEKDKLKPVALVEYLEDANQQLFETNYIGAELYRSDDGGKSWKKTHEGALEQMFFTYGYYFANVRCMPNDADQVYVIGFYIIRSDDGGKTWKNINGDNVHVDHHALWLNPAKPGHLVNGNDGGLNISWDNGASWLKCNNPPVGQFYAVTTDDAQPYQVYGGAQDNGVWVGPSDYASSDAWHQTGEYPYKELMGGDGMQIQVDYRDNETVYTGFQFGNYFRMKKSGGRPAKISPEHELGERPLRFNWQTPIHLSRHQQDVLYIGSNKLYRSFNQGNDWEAISSDLTQGGKPGNVPYGTLTSIDESPLKFGLLYTGSDDGLIYVTRDGGETWSRISEQLPQNLWVSRVQASAHQRARVYASLNGYRWDDFTAYLYVSEDYGQTWKSLGANLPAEPINVVKEDPVNENLLYVGTDHHLYISLDRGNTFHTLNSKFPDVPVHDLAVQNKAKELIIGTHGRSMFKLNIDHLQQMNNEFMGSSIQVFDLPKKRFNRGWGKKPAYEVAKDPACPVWYYANKAGKINWTLKHKESGIILNVGAQNCVQGLNHFDFDLSVQDSSLKSYKEKLQSAQKDAKKPLELEKADTGKTYLRKGAYVFSFEYEGKTVDKELIIE
ncbi:MAG: glycosyl hydrolase [Saprospiraceae bacterium]|nr:glycosyl hydrolase [Saprospiraceae bacterium]